MSFLHKNDTKYNYNQNMKTLESVFINNIKPFYTYTNIYYFPPKQLDEINTFTNIFEHHKECSMVIHEIHDIHTCINNIHAMMYPININKFEVYVKLVFNELEDIKSANQFITKLRSIKKVLQNPIKYQIVYQTTIL